MVWSENDRRNGTGRGEGWKAPWDAPLPMSHGKQGRILLRLNSKASPNSRASLRIWSAVHPLFFQGISWKIRRACPRRRHRRQFWLCLCLGSIGAGVESRGRAWCGTHPFRAQHAPNRVTRSRPVLNGVTTPSPGPATASPPGRGTIMNPPNRRFAPSTRRALLTPVDSRLVPNRTRPQRQARMGP